MSKITDGNEWKGSLHRRYFVNFVNFFLMETNIAIWVPTVSAALGGILVLAGQSIDRWAKNKSELKKNLFEIYAYSKKLEAQMKNNYRQLAMTKTHIEYWWYCHLNEPAANVEFKKKLYEEHLRSQSDARMIEKNIGEVKAEFIGNIKKFQALNPITDTIDIKISEILELTQDKAKVYDLSKSASKVHDELVIKDEKELREKYYKNLAPFMYLNSLLEQVIKSK